MKERERETISIRDAIGGSFSLSESKMLLSFFFLLSSGNTKSTSGRMDRPSNRYSLGGSCSVLLRMCEAISETSGGLL
jgi:hypothetical protein